MQNLETGNGVIAMVSRGLKELFRSVGGKTSQLNVQGNPDEGFFIFDGDTVFAGPYKTAASAKGQLTRYQKGYTPASRRPNEG